MNERLTLKRMFVEMRERMGGSDVPKGKNVVNRVGEVGKGKGG